MRTRELLLVSSLSMMSPACNAEAPADSEGPGESGGDGDGDPGDGDGDPGDGDGDPGDGDGDSESCPAAGVRIGAELTPEHVTV